MKKRYKDYLHADKEGNWRRAEKLGLVEGTEAFEYFIYTLYEVGFDMEVDTETGDTFIIAVNGVELKKPIKG